MKIDKKCILIAVASAVLVAAVANAALTIPVRCNYGWICAHCGSWKHQAEWIWGSRSSAAVEVSALGTWLLARDRKHTHQWRRVEGTKRNVFGRAMGFSHGPAPPIMYMPPALLQQYVEGAAEDELRRFSDVMREGSEREQEELIRRVCKQTLDGGD